MTNREVWQRSWRFIWITFLIGCVLEYLVYAVVGEIPPHRFFDFFTGPTIVLILTVLYFSGNKSWGGGSFDSFFLIQFPLVMATFFFAYAWKDFGLPGGLVTLVPAYVIFVLIFLAIALALAVVCLPIRFAMWLTSKFWPE
jgi:hypothetical protein